MSYNGIVNVVVNKPKKKTVLKFKNAVAGARGRYILILSDDNGRISNCAFDDVKTFVPSTLFSMWVNHFLRKELLVLVGQGSSVEYEGKDGWEFRDSPKYFGLHDIIKKNGKPRFVQIDKSIGMKKVVDILNAIGYTVDIIYDDAVSLIKEIHLSKEG